MILLQSESSIFPPLMPGDNGDVKLSVDGEDEDQVFFINPSSSLCLKAELDREMQNFYNVTVAASDRVQPAALQLTSTAQVYVTVGDVNDNAPRFVSANMVKITEDAALHSVVMTVRTEDDDDGSNALVLYYLNTTAEGTFRIDSSSGEIRLTEMLNREMHDSLILTVTAIDEGSPRMTTSSSLTVLIEDVNNHDPEFLTNLYNVAVREDVRGGTSLLQVSALDRDIGMNGEVRYMMDKVSPFSVDAVRGVVMVTERLDRESDAEYTLTLTAVDLGEPPRSTTALINVTVMDINDFVPSFNPELLTLHVMENEEDVSKLTYQVLLFTNSSWMLSFIIHLYNTVFMFLLRFQLWIKILAPTASFSTLFSVEVGVTSPLVSMGPFRFYTAWTEKSKQCTSLPLLLLIQVSQSKLTVFCFVKALLSYNLFDQF